MSLATLLIAVGGFLLGGAWSLRTRNVVLAVALGVCAVVSVTAGILRLV